MTVVEWLLDSDPAIRWQVLRDLVQAPPDVVDSERARVAKEGWGARMLALQGNDGLWAGGACFPARNLIHADRDTGQPWISTLPTLQLLCDFGVDPRTDRVRQAVALVKENCRWEHAGQPFFSGEVEPCINGRTVKLGVYFDQDVEGIVTPPAARPNPSRPGAVARNTSSNERSFGARAAAKSSIPTGCGSRFRPGGITTCCVRWATSAPREALQIRGWMRRLTCCDQAAARRHVAAGEHASRRGPLRARGWRRSAQPVEHT